MVTRGSAAGTLVGVITGLLVAGALAGVFGLARARRGRESSERVGRKVRAPVAGPAASTDGPPSDAALDAAFDAVLAEHAHELRDLLETRLRGLVARRVPVRAVRRAPGSHTARICFADGTVVLARSAGTRDLVALVVGMQRGSVVLSGFAREGAGTRLDLSTQSGRPLALMALGLDQPD